MKKTLGKPGNWQDFEDLCKKLWGVLWGIQNKIKKNGRLGQTQSGVDVYGIPKGVTQYWGIQSKGKDDYSNTKLTESEVLNEIEKAKTFKPKLKVFIIATTSNKDSKIEQFVRLKDMENRQQGSFEILLFCWEDIVDLLESNQEVYHWYLNGINQKGTYDFKISFNEMQDHLILNPILEKEITKYKLVEQSDLSRFLGNSIIPPIDPITPFHSNMINKSWCNFDLVMENTGSAVLEDWKIVIVFIEGVYKLDTGSPYFPNLSLTQYIDDENKTITYSPNGNKPLIQKDNRFFEISLLPKPYANKIIMEWELLARDFSRKEIVEINIEPKFIEKIFYRNVTEESELKDDKVNISYHVIEKDNKSGL